MSTYIIEPTTKFESMAFQNPPSLSRLMGGRVSANTIVSHNKSEPKSWIGSLMEILKRWPNWVLGGI